MTRSILAALTAAVAVVVLSGTGCQSTGVGDPCTPEQEYDPMFLGYDFHEVGVEPGSFQCLTRLCLVNHFQGRVTCPYGQEAANTTYSQAASTKGNPVPMSPATAPCNTPGLHTSVSGQVLPQCTDRPANSTVYCSCRCADLNGQTANGNFCTCPDGFSCTPLVTSLGAGADQQLVGSYCIKSGTAYPVGTGGTTTTCAAPECGVGGSVDCGNTDNTGN
ncbi:MAG: hypothetical protein ACREJ3_13505 [Polyangiaceae bacterium]